MISVSDILVVVLVATNTPLVIFLKFTVTDLTHSGSSVVFQVTPTPAVEPLTLSALAVTVEETN